MFHSKINYIFTYTLSHGDYREHVLVQTQRYRLVQGVPKKVILFVVKHRISCAW